MAERRRNLRITRHARRRMRERGIRAQWCEAVLEDYVQKEIDEKGCTAYWGNVPGRNSPLKVVVGTDGRSLVAARFDRHFQTSD